MHVSDMASGVTEGFLKCSQCEDFTTTSEEKFVEHIDAKHKIQGACWCSNCGFCFSDATQLVEHIKKEECQIGSITFLCGVNGCGYSTYYGRKLVDHLKAHHRGNPFLSCAKCKKYFTVPHCLILHIQRTCEDVTTSQNCRKESTESSKSQNCSKKSTQNRKSKNCRKESTQSPISNSLGSNESDSEVDDPSYCPTSAVKLPIQEEYKRSVTRCYKKKRIHHPSNDTGTITEKRQYCKKKKINKNSKKGRIRHRSRGRMSNSTNMRNDCKESDAVGSESSGSAVLHEEREKNMLSVVKDGTEEKKIKIISADKTDEKGDLGNAGYQNIKKNEVENDEIKVKENATIKHSIGSEEGTVTNKYFNDTEDDKDEKIFLGNKERCTKKKQRLDCVIEGKDKSEPAGNNNGLMEKNTTPTDELKISMQCSDVINYDNSGIIDVNEVDKSGCESMDCDSIKMSTYEITDKYSDQGDKPIHNYTNKNDEEKSNNCFGVQNYTNKNDEMTNEEEKSSNNYFKVQNFSDHCRIVSEKNETARTEDKSINCDVNNEMLTDKKNNKYPDQEVKPLQCYISKNRVEITTNDISKSASVDVVSDEVAVECPQDKSYHSISKCRGNPGHSEILKEICCNKKSDEKEPVDNVDGEGKASYSNDIDTSVDGMVMADNNCKNQDECGYRETDSCNLTVKKDIASDNSLTEGKKQMLKFSDGNSQDTTCEYDRLMPELEPEGLFTKHYKKHFQNCKETSRYSPSITYNKETKAYQASIGIDTCDQNKKQNNAQQENSSDQFKNIKPCPLRYKKFIQGLYDKPCPLRYKVQNSALNSSALRYQCGYCLKNAASFSEIIEHFDGNHAQAKLSVYFIPDMNDLSKDSDLYKCSLCKKGPDFLENLKHHWQTTHSIKDFKVKIYFGVEYSKLKCHYCGVKLPSIIQFREHCKEKHPYQSVKFAKISSKHKINQKGQDSRNMKESSTTGGKNEQPIVEIISSSSEDEVYSRLSKPVFPCDKCQYIGDSIKHLHEHNSHEHQPFACNYCNQGFNSFFFLKSHHEWHHPTRPLSQNKKCDLDNLITSNSFETGQIYIKRTVKGTEQQIKLPLSELKKLFNFYPQVVVIKEVD